MRNVKLWLRALLGCALLAGAVAATAQTAQQPVQPPKLELRTQTLANGLGIVMLEDHSAPVVNLQVWYHVGSKDERPGRTGFAHLFEHFMFKGSAHVGPDEHSRIVEAVGGFDNATTNFDATIYWETFPSNFLERVLWLEADRMGSLNVDDANFKSEREVVKEERRQRYENSPYGLVAEDLYSVAFRVHPYKHLPIGSMDDLNKATVEDVRDFFRTFYRPDNATLVIAGDFDPAQAVPWAEKYFGGIPRPATPVPRVGVEEPPQQAEQRVAKFYGSNSPLPAVVAGYRLPARYSADSYALDLAANILSQGESSRLYRKLVYEDRIALQAVGFGLFTEQPNLFWVIAVMNQGHAAAEGEQAINAALERLQTEPVEAKELEKAKNQVISNFILGRRTVQQKADAIGEAAVFGKDPNLINTELERYRRLTADDIQRVARKYFVPAQRTVLVVEPPKSSENLPQAGPPQRAQTFAARSR
jgi:zinc protease